MIKSQTTNKDNNMTSPIKTCGTCGSDLLYDGLPAWYCEACGSVFNDDFEPICIRWNGEEYEIAPVSPDGE